MPFRVSPGVNWTERDLTNIVPGIATSVGAYVGQFQWGPAEEVITISSENQLVERFGKPNEDTYRSFFSAASFLAYSDHLKLVRVVGKDARNAASGGDGEGLTLDTNVVNGEIRSVSINAPGTKYIAGDLVLIESAVSPATLRVTGVTNEGAVQTLELLGTGKGHIETTGKATQVITNVEIKNDDDLDDDIFLPEVVARYPGELGNSILFSAVRASEFENWTFNNRFGVAPDATTITWDGNGTKTLFALPDGMTELPDDSVVTVQGFARSEGVDPGNYRVVNGSVEFIEEVEAITADGSTELFTLSNEYDLDPVEANVDVDGTKFVRYEGVGPVPAGLYRVKGDQLEFGLNDAYLAGDGQTADYVLTSVTGITDAKVVVDGDPRTAVYTGAPASGEVLFEESGGNTEVTFPVGEEPAIGALNVEIYWGYVADGATITVKYGAPKDEDANVKVFYNQTEIHAVVVDVDGKWTGEELSLLERYEFLSLVPGTKFYDGSTLYYVDAINRRSQYVRMGTQLFNYGGKRLTGAVDSNKSGTEITPGILQGGYNLFKNAEEIDLNHVIGGDVDSATAIWIISNLVEARKDCVAYFSPPFSACVNNKGREVKDITAWRNQLPSTSYAAADDNWKLVYDRYNDKTRWIPCAGDQAGLYAFTHDNVDPWWSAAGLNRGRVKNTIKLAWYSNETDRDQLYPQGVNSIAWFRGEGAVLWGDRTLLKKPSAFDRMNVRWLFIVLEKAIAEAARYFLFEFNDESTRNQFKNTVHPFLRDVQGRRGIFDFKVVCDETNNPGSVIDRNEFVGDILIKPARSINFIQLNFVAVGTDVNFDEFASQV